MQVEFFLAGPESDKLGSYLYPPARADEEKSTYSTCSAVLKEVPIVPVPLHFDHHDINIQFGSRVKTINFVSRNNNLVK